MPDRSRKKQPRDPNALAKLIVDKATGEESPEDSEPKPQDPSLNNWDNEGGAILPADSGKDPAAVALGRKGGLKGGKARAANMTPEERSEAARKAAKARWGREKEDES